MSRVLRPSGHSNEAFVDSQRLRETELGVLVTQLAYEPLPLQAPGPLYRAGIEFAYSGRWQARPGYAPLSLRGDAYGVVSIWGSAYWNNEDNPAIKPPVGWTLIAAQPSAYRPGAQRIIQARQAGVESPQYQALYIDTDGGIRGWVYGESDYFGWGYVIPAARYSRT